MIFYFYHVKSTIILINNIMTKATVKSISKHFGFEPHELNQLIYDITGFIAGSAPLNIFVGDDIWDNIDLDIFVPIPARKNNNTSLKHYYYAYEELVLYKVNHILTNKGYTKCQREINQDASQNEEYIKFLTANSEYIKSVHTYKRDDNVKIQIIFIYDQTIDEFLNTFDFDIVKFTLESRESQCGPILPISSELKLITDYVPNKDRIKSRIMTITNDSHVQLKHNLIKRAVKYALRGFTLV